MILCIAEGWDKLDTWIRWTRCRIIWWRSKRSKTVCIFTTCSVYISRSV